MIQSSPSPSYPLECQRQSYEVLRRLVSRDDSASSPSFLLLHQLSESLRACVPAGSPPPSLQSLQMPSASGATAVLFASSSGPWSSAAFPVRRPGLGEDDASLSSSRATPPCAEGVVARLGGAWRRALPDLSANAYAAEAAAALRSLGSSAPATAGGDDAFAPFDSRRLSESMRRAMPASCAAALGEASPAKSCHPPLEQIEP